jgi:broad specificity phosphatase PhoE
MNATTAENHVNQPEIWLIRHGETEWSLSGQHTGRTDIPLTEHGRAQARSLRPVLAAQPFDLVLCSPMSRARDTCAEAGLGGQAEEELRLSEWDYGIYEGRKTKDIRAEDPDWSVWTSPIPQGESVEEIQARAESLIQRLLATSGRIALFSHAHLLRVLSGCWMGDSAVLGAHLLLDTASVSVLGFDRETRALKQWNVRYSQS